MDEKMNVLLKKINIDEDSYQYFQDAKLTKIKINSSTNSWNVFIEKNDLAVETNMICILKTLNVF